MIAVFEQPASGLTLRFSFELCRPQLVGRDFASMTTPEEPVPFGHRLPQAQIVEELLSRPPSGTKLLGLGMESYKQWNRPWRAISLLQRYR